MKKILPSQGIAVIIAQLVLVVNIFCLVPVVRAEDISEEMEGRISMGCESIRIQLKTLQKMDSRMRVYLGSKYEIVLSNFMTNLNLRLVKNNMATETLTGLQTTFSSERERFKADFTGYSQALEGLIGMDCKNEPQKFYTKLVEVRGKRAGIQASYYRLNEVMGLHREGVIEVKDGL